jgi:hypothetical protein
LYLIISSAAFSDLTDTQFSSGDTEHIEMQWRGLAELLGLIRGYWLEMPVHILLPYLLVKGYRSLAESLFGGHIFTKKSLEITDNLGENLKK